MSIIQYIRSLNEKGIQFSYLDNQLKIKAPEGVLNSEIVNDIKSRKDDIINFLKDIEVSTFASEIRKIEKKEYYKLSSAQQRLFFLYNFDKTSLAYNILYTFRLNGELKKGRLQNAFSKLIKRHESLRTSFHIVNGEFVQKVEENTDVDIHYESVNENEIQKTIDDFNKPFDLSKSPLIRIKVINLSLVSHILLINIHHIGTDGSSFDILKKDFITFYQNSQLPELKLQYKDYSEWQQNNQHKRKIEEQKLWWINEFSPIPPLLELPIDFKRPPEMTYEGAIFNYELTENLTNSVKQFSEVEGTSLFMVLLAALNILFAKLSNLPDIVIGIPSTSRKNRHLEDIIGLFANTLPVRNYPKGDLRVSDFLANLKNKTLQAIDNQNYQFEDLINDLNLDRDTSRSPLFDVMFIMNENYQKNEIKGELSISPYSFENSSSKFDMLILATDFQDKISLKIEYYTRIFKASTIERFVKYFLNILSIIIKEPSRKIEEIEIVSNEEKARLLFEFNNTKYDHVLENTLFDLLEDQKNKTPDRIALSFNSKSFTYQDLVTKSILLSDHLFLKGILSGDVVGILMERSNEMIVAMYSIFKIGATLLPLDPDYPFDRISYIVKNSKCKLLITDELNSHKYEELKSEDCLNNHLILSSDVISNSEILKENHSPTFQEYRHRNQSELGLKSSSNAYLLYTSGSTGLPKGIIIEHKSVVNFIAGITNIIDFNENDFILALTTIAFDIFVLETFLPLSKGLTVVIANEEQQTSPFKLSKLINDSRISMLQLTPSRLQLLLDDKDNGNCFSGVKTLMVGGEAFPESLLENLKTQFKGKIYNMYGPTETTVWSTVKELTSENKINIGKPIANTQIYILSENLKLQPIGVPGELFIGGAGLAQGYAYNQELTNQRFLTNPFIHNNSIYKTGDLARWNENGEIEYLGRIDNQVKVRGYRIELGEIENQMRLFPEVKDAVVHLKGKESNTCLIGYYTSDKLIEVKELRLHLTKCLPEYMIPVHFMHLNELPLTPNGKIDRKKLSDYDIAAVQVYVPAKNMIENRLVKIWSEVLNLSSEKISTNTSFFELGGHSLKSAIMVNKIHKLFDIEIPIKEIFRLHNIQAIADLISISSKKYFKHLVKVEKKEYYKLSSAQRRLSFLYQFDKSSIAYNIPYILTIEGSLDYDKLTRSFNKLISRHESLRSTFHLINEVFVQKIERATPLTIELFSSSEVEAQKFIKQFIRPFDLSCCPLVRIGLIKIKEQEHILMVDMHHIISDGMSEGILIKEFMAFYNNEELPDFDIHYKDYAEWQQSDEHQINLIAQKDFWLNEFAEKSNALNLPTDFPRPLVQSFEGSSVDFRLSKTDSSRLKEIAENEGATIFMVLLSIFNILLSKLGNQESIVIGTPTAGRRHADIEKLVGILVNTLPICNRVEGELGFNEFLANVKAKTLACFDNQDLQYEDLIDGLRIERDLSRNPLFDIMFVFQNYESSELIIPGLTLKQYNIEHKTSKFDITLKAFDSLDELFFSFEYSTALFRKETIDRFIEYFKKIVIAVTNNVNTKISAIDFLSDKEKQQLLNEFNNTKTEYPKDKTICQLFEEQVIKTPFGIALVFNDRFLTYDTLNARSNQLANYILQNEGINTDDLIALMLERSEDVLVAVLSILKTGAAYVPLDPVYPQDRIDIMLNDCKPKLVVTHSRYASGFNSEHTVIIDNIPWNTLSPRNLNINSSPRDLAYAMYTSGSTGVPKGTLVEHRSVVRLVKNTNYIEINTTDQILQTGAPVFDATTFEYWGALLNGATLNIVSEDVLLNVQSLKEVISKRRISVMWLTAGLFNTLIEQDNAIFSTLTYLLVGGDILSPKHINKALRESSGVSIINGYGPTENTTFSTTFRIAREFDTRIPIGKPVANTTAYILDKSGNLQPIGVEGELFLGGDGVARSYLNKEELTREKFIDSPFVIGDRLYRTGDFARWQPDGNIEFLGRRDNQVKLRGFRIELGEIESRLLNHELIQDVVVLIKEQADNKNIVAYYTSNEEINALELRNFLSDKLPAYMVPSFFIWLKNIPLTTNGKIDKKSLPEPAINIGNEYIGPTNDTEIKLLEIWSDILKISKELISIDRNFFEIGGNSLNATTLISKIKKEFDVEFSIKDLFKLNSIEEQALLISASQNIEIEGITEENTKSLIL